MDYTIASYRGEGGFDAATQVIELFIWLALIFQKTCKNHLKNSPLL